MVKCKKKVKEIRKFRRGSREMYLERSQHGVTQEFRTEFLAEVRDHECSCITNCPSCVNFSSKSQKDMDARAEKSRWLESQILMKARECVLKALKTPGFVSHGRGGVAEEGKVRKTGQQED